MKHKVFIKTGILNIILSGEVSDKEYEILADRVNELMTDDCSKILIDAADFQADKESDVSRFRRKVQFDDCRAAVVNGFLSYKTSRKQILEMFSGDYEVAFFENTGNAMRWLEDSTVLNYSRGSE